MKRIICILAGGRSKRFGSSKLAVRIADRPLISHLNHRLSGAFRSGNEWWLSLAPGQSPPPGSGCCQRWVYDPVSFGGPLPAMEATLNAAQQLPGAQPSDVVVFVAADMPAVTSDYLRTLLRELRLNRELAGVMGWAGEQVEPLPSVWRAGPGLKLVRRAMASGIRSPHRLLRYEKVSTVSVKSNSTLFLNVNRVSDMELVKSTLGDCSHRATR